jgi:hypothetical protein
LFVFSSGYYIVCLFVWLLYCLSFSLAIILFVFSSGYYIVCLFVRLLYCLSFRPAIAMFVFSSCYYIVCLFVRLLYCLSFLLAIILFVFSSGYYIVCLFVLLLHCLSFRLAIILFVFSSGYYIVYLFVRLLYCLFFDLPFFINNLKWNMKQDISKKFRISSINNIIFWFLKHNVYVLFLFLNNACNVLSYCWMSTIQYQTNTKADSASGDVLQTLITTPLSYLLVIITYHTYCTWNTIHQNNNNDFSY